MNPLFPKAFIFDWDNTLVDSWPTITDAINQTRVQFGLPAWPLDEIKLHCTRAARDSFPEWFGDQWEKAYEFYYQNFDALRRSRAIQVKAGAHDLLLWLKDRNIPSFVVSNKRGDYLRHEVERLQWQDLFKAVVGAQDAPRDKPAREHVDHALNHAEMEAHASVWFVGDSAVDMECAVNAGCTPVFIGNPAEAEKLNVKLVFSDCQGLKTLLYNRSEKL